MLEYVAGHSDAWEQTFTTDQDDDNSRPSYELLASLDTALLALVERLDCEEDDLPKLLDDILQDSLWTRTLSRRSPDEAIVQRKLLLQRASFIWSNSTEIQRRGYFAAGVGLYTGNLLDQSADDLNRLLLSAEVAIADGDVDAALEAVTEFAHIALAIPPFAPKEMPSGWEQVLREWIEGKPMADIVSADPEGLVEFIDDAIVYRLVWAVEAVRVRSAAHRDEYAELWTGRVAEALEAGTMDRCAVILIHAGLGSRLAAAVALADFPADFEDFQGMNFWLASEDVAEASTRTDWPTPDTAELWQRFVNTTPGQQTRAWSVQFKRVGVNWRSDANPLAGEFLRIRYRNGKSEICRPDFTKIGELKYGAPNLPGILFGRAAPGLKEIEVTYHGPSTLK